MRFQSYFNTAVKIIQLYDGSGPLTLFLKHYFAQHKKHGSKDRKLIAHVCYNYYRTGCAFKELNVEERLKVAFFLCNAKPGEWFFLFEDEWLQHWSNVLDGRIAFVKSKYASFSLDAVFPFAHHLSDDIDKAQFIRSHFIQPDVFLRIRPHQQMHVINALKRCNLSFEQREDDCIALPGPGKIDTILKLDEEAVVQDYSSQQIKKFLQAIELQTESSTLPTRIWDCCAGSGGKSILAYDVLKNIQVTATDIRASIIHNLKQRFQTAGMRNYKTCVIDIANSAYPISNAEFDLIICDAPCTGSGTWSRTPEQLYFFDEKKIDEYAGLQQQIVGNVLPHLKTGGYFLYITCSVFEKENENIVSFIQKNLPADEEGSGLQLLKMELLKGYNKKADTMFAALFRR